MVILWQDIVLMVCGFVFAPALIVSIRRKTKYPLGTSLPTALALTVMSVCTLTLGLYLATITNIITAICWYLLAKRR